MQNKGFTVVGIAEPYDVTLFPNSESFEPTPGLAIGIETCNQFGTRRLIVKYLNAPLRKVSGDPTYWPNGVVYVHARDVQGWK